MKVLKGLRRALRRQFPGKKITIERGSSIQPRNSGRRPPAKFRVGTLASGGVIGGEAHRGALRVRNSYVAAGERGKGAGSKLYAGLERAARGTNRELHSDVASSLDAARRYRALARGGHKVFYRGTRAKFAGSRLLRADRDMAAGVKGAAAFIVNPRTRPPRGYRRVFHKGDNMSNKLIETNEGVEKSAKLTVARGGTTRALLMAHRQMRAKGLTRGEGLRRVKLANYLADRRSGRLFGNKRRTGVYKSLTALSEAIEKARYTTRNIAGAFGRGAKRGKAGAMRIDGDTLYSYARPIAHRKTSRSGKPFIHYAGEGRDSVTTNRHIGSLYRIPGMRGGPKRAPSGKRTNSSAQRAISRRLAGAGSYTGVRKLLDALDAIEKGRGMIRGGSPRMARVANSRAGGKYHGFGRTARADTLKRYAGLRADGLRNVRTPGWRGTVTFRSKD